MRFLPRGSMNCSKLVGLHEEAQKKVGTYSKGMRQRLGIAEVLIKEPEADLPR